MIWFGYKEGQHCFLCNGCQRNIAIEQPLIHGWTIDEFTKMKTPRYFVERILNVESDLTNADVVYQLGSGKDGPVVAQFCRECVMKHAQAVRDMINGPQKTS